MSNYKETQAVGTSWQRAYSVTISNNIGQVPVITFYEQKVIQTDVGLITTSVGQMTEYFSDPLVEFNLLHPETGMILGTSTYQNIYVMLHSLYMHLANKRDTPPAPTPAPAPAPAPDPAPDPAPAPAPAPAPDPAPAPAPRP